MSIIGAVASSLRGGRFVFKQHTPHEHVGDLTLVGGAVPGEVAIESDVVR
jgi:hypothetical protein